MREQRFGKYGNISLRIAVLLLALCLLFCSCQLEGLGTLADVGHGNKQNETSRAPFVPAVIEEVTAEAFSLSYGDQLNANERAVYTALLNAAPGEHAFRITLPQALEICQGREPSEDEKNATSKRLSSWLDSALYAAWLDAPMLFWLETGDYSYSYLMEADARGVYAVKTVTLDIALRQGYEELAPSWATQLNAKLDVLSLGADDPIETVRNIDRYLCDSITYEQNVHQATVFGALVEGVCVCEGYAHAFALLCAEYGITCACIVGNGVTDGESEGHMWNAVLIDGVWYAVDVTWNDSTQSEAYLLTGAQTVAHGDTFAASHLATPGRGNSKTFALPSLSATEYGR